ncbi:MAG: VTT domain-containing protein [Minicystis sp.]
MLELVRNPVAYFFAMIVVFSAASLPPSPPTLMAAKDNPPLLLAALASAAAGIAAVVDWVLVRRVFRLGTLERARQHPMFERAERWAKVAPFLTVVTFAALPLPFMCARVLMPLTGYPWPRYAAAVAIGRFPRVFVIAAFGQAFDIPSWVLEGLFAGGVLLAVIIAILRRLGWIGAPPAKADHSNRAPPAEANRSNGEPPPPT